MTKIPSEEDFARADKLDKESWHNINKINERAEKQLKGICPLSFFCLMPQLNDEFRTLVAFEKEKDLEAYVSRGEPRETADEVFLFFKNRHEGNRVSQISEALHEIIDIVYAELERGDRGKRGDIAVTFEFDSDENIKANPHYKGDYFLRLR